MSKRTDKQIRKIKTFKPGIITLLVIIVCSCYFGSFFSSAHNTDTSQEHIREKYYRSIEIQKGDSIWKIASENVSEEYQSLYEYIDEILAINNISLLSADKIQEGDYLTIAFYR